MLDIGASEGFGKFMDSVNTATKTFNGIGLDIANNALPAVGRFIEKMAELIEIFFDAGSIKVFFETLNVVLQGLIFLLDNDFMRAVITGTGLMIAFGLAIGTVTKTAGFFGKVFVGAITKIDKVLLARLPQQSKLVYQLRFAVMALQAQMVALAAPILIAVGVIATIVAIFVLAYQKSEKLREAIADMVAVVKDKLMESFEKIKVAIDKALPFMGKMSDVFKMIGDFLAVTLVPLLKLFIDLIGSIFTKIGSAKDKIVEFWEKMKEIFGLIKTLSIGDIFAGLWTSFKKAIEKIIDGWNNLSFSLNVPKNKLTEFLNIDGMGFTLNTPNISKAFLNLAKGGIIAPSANGTLARIAEAGRPERVEPLDPSGLSKRDRAMIEMLAGPAGGAINITVNPSPGMDERELAALVSRQLAFQLRRGAA